MNYANPALLEILAQRYVVGAMSYRARRRFTQILQQQSLAKDRVLAWEERLVPLALSLDPVQPSELVWQRISRELQPAPAAQKTGDSTKQWGLSYAAAAVLIISVSITSLGWWQASNRLPETILETVFVDVPEPAAISVLASNEQTLWVARIYQKAARLDIEVQIQPEAQPDKDYELWALRDDGVPVSLGLLPKQGRVSIALNDIAKAALSRSANLAVSLEPTGGSPKAVPTGPVILSAALFAS